MSKKCPTCGEAFRKGRRRIVHHFDGSISVALVCPACVARTLSIVTQFPRAGLTVSGVELLQKVSDRLRTHLKAAALTQHPDHVDEFLRGRADALSCAIELIQRAIAGIEP